MEPVAEQIVAALQAKLAGIEGDGGATAWYTVDRCLRAPAFHGGCLDSSLSTIYVIAPDDEETEEEGSHRLFSRMRLDVILAHKFEPGDPGPFTPSTPLRETVQNRLIHDALLRLRTFPSLTAAMSLGQDANGNDLAYNVEVTLTDRGADLTYFQGWAAAFLRVQVTYGYDAATP